MTAMGRMDAATVTRTRRSKNTSMRLIVGKSARHLRRRDAAIARKAEKTGGDA